MRVLGLEASHNPEVSWFESKRESKAQVDDLGFFCYPLSRGDLVSILTVVQHRAPRCRQRAPADPTACHSATWPCRTPAKRGPVRTTFCDASYAVRGAQRLNPSPAPTGGRFFHFFGSRTTSSSASTNSWMSGSPTRCVIRTTRRTRRCSLWSAVSCASVAASGGRCPRRSEGRGRSACTAWDSAYSTSGAGGSSARGTRLAT